MKIQIPVNALLRRCPGFIRKYHQKQMKGQTCELFAGSQPGQSPTHRGNRSPADLGRRWFYLAAVFFAVHGHFVDASPGAGGGRILIELQELNLTTTALAIVQGGKTSERRTSDSSLETGSVSLMAGSVAEVAPSKASVASLSEVAVAGTANGLKLEVILGANLFAEAEFQDVQPRPFTAEASSRHTFNVHLQSRQPLHFTFRVEQSDPAGLVSQANFEVFELDSWRSVITTSWGKNAEVIQGQGWVESGKMRASISMEARASRGDWFSQGDSLPNVQGEVEIRLVLQLAPLPWTGPPGLEPGAMEDNQTRLLLNQLAPGKRYVVERSTSLDPLDWVRVHEFIAESLQADWGEPWPEMTQALFYRVLQTE
jgi:hypothetical protein